MIQKEKCLVLDVDGTICKIKSRDQAYSDIEPIVEVVNKINEYKKMGFYIILYSARNMNTHSGNLGKINADTLPTMIEWLKKHNIPYDEIHIGKPWPGKGGFYVDDKAIRPNEFVNNSYEKILELISHE